MKILVMLPRVPFPLHDGGAIAMFNLVKGLKENGADLTVFAYNTIKHFNDPIPQEIKGLGSIHTVFIDNRVKPLGAFLNLFSSTSYNIERFKSEKVEQELSVILSNNTFDIIHFDSLYTGIYLSIVKRLSPNTKCVLRQHNVEYQIWDRIAQGASLLKKAYLNILVKRLKQEEDTLIPEFDAIVPITDVDAISFEQSGAKKQHVCPVGVNMGSYTTVQKESNTSLNVFHLGSLDWMPNLEGIEWFLNEVWPLVIKELPKVQFHIAGRNMPQWITALDGSNNIVIDGEIPSAPEYLKSNSIMVVPLKSGSGMRVKIIEGFAAGKAIVSTTVGAEGIKYSEDENIAIADTPVEFSNKLIDLLGSKEKIAQMGQQAQVLVSREYSDVSTAKSLMHFYEGLIVK